MNLQSCGQKEIKITSKEIPSFKLSKITDTEFMSNYDEGRAYGASTIFRFKR